MVGKGSVRALLYMQYRGLPIFPVVEFGARCNGTDDDTQPLQNAIAAAAAAHGAVILPAGADLRITSTIQVTASGWKLMGSGGTAFRPTITVTGNIVGLALGSGATVVEGVEICDVKFVGASGTNTAQHAIDVLNCKVSQIRRCYFTGFTGYAIDGTGGGADRTFLIAFDECLFVSNFAGGIRLNKAGGVAGNSIHRCAFAANSFGTGIYSLEVIGYTDASIVECDFEDTVTAGTNAAIHVDGVFAARIAGNHSESASFIHAGQGVNICAANLVTSNGMTYNGSPMFVFGNGFQNSIFMANLLSAGAIGGTGFSISNITGKNTFEGNYYENLTTNKSLLGTNADRDL